MQRNALCPLLFAACAEIPPPEGPSQLATSASDFAVAYSRTAIVSRRALHFDGGEVPGTGPLNIAPTGVALGRRHACVRTETGEVQCWGDHQAGALGESRGSCPGATPENTSPSCVLGVNVVPNLPPVRDVVAGDDVTCAILAEDDHVVCWGSAGLLGGSRLPTTAPRTDVVAGDAPLVADRVIIAHRSICAIDRDAAAWCWGDGFASQPQRQPQTGVVDLAIGRQHSCIIDATGLTCSGNNRNNQVGDLEHARACGPASDCTLGSFSIPIAATRVVVGDRHTCALDRDGIVSCWGSNEVGQLARSDAFLVGGVARSFTGAIDVESGFAHVCAQRDDLSVWCWGDPGVADPLEQGTTP